MLQCLTRTCVRTGRRFVDPAGVQHASVLLARGQGVPCLLAVDPSTEAQWRGFAVSMSAASSRRPSREALVVDPAAPPPPLEPPVASPSRAGSHLAGENFGSMAAYFSSRRSFRKTSRALRDQRYQDDEEEEGVGFKSATGRTNTPYWYFLQCKRLIKENKLSEALDLFDREMLKGERLQPEEFNYTVLIGGCGRTGHVKQAFKLYNDMKKRGLVATDATYTALFNACAESPWKQAGLQRALLLEQELRRLNHPLADITYHALLKTHALTNHLGACLHTLREMLENGHAVTQETFHYVLMACVKDKDVGFRQALQVWRQMLKTGISPDRQNYNLLLRAARDCGIGDGALASALLLTPGPPRGTEGGSKVTRKSRGGGAPPPLDLDSLETQLFIQPGHYGNKAGHHGNNSLDSAVVPVMDGSGQATTQLVTVREEQSQTPIGSLSCQSIANGARPPNLLDLWVSETGVVSVGSASGASDRLALMGGAEGVLDKMAADGLQPDLRTVTLLADLMEPGVESLMSLLKVAKQHGLKLDAAFFNTAIRRSARAGDMEGAKAVVRVMFQRNVSVDMQTYGSLALGCAKQWDGLQLLKDMEAAGRTPNVQVFSALIGQAARRLDYIYLKELLRTMKQLGVAPNEVIIKQLEFASQYPPNYDPYKSKNNYLCQIDGFRGYYQVWLRTMPAREDPLPWETRPEEEEPPERGPERDQADQRSVAQKNMQAAARRYQAGRSKKQRS